MRKPVVSLHLQLQYMSSECLSSTYIRVCRNTVLACWETGNITSSLLALIQFCLESLTIPHRSEIGYKSLLWMGIKIQMICLYQQGKLKKQKSQQYLFLTHIYSLYCIKIPLNFNSKFHKTLRNLAVSQPPILGINTKPTPIHPLPE